MTDESALLKAILSTMARQVFPVEELKQIVAPHGSSAKQLQAFNLCDGDRSQSEIAKILKLDSGNFSRTVARWIAAGVVFRLGDGKDSRLIHIYRLPTA